MKVGVMVEANGFVTFSCFESMVTKFVLESVNLLFVKVILTGNIFVKRHITVMNANPVFLAVIVINVPTQNKLEEKKQQKTIANLPAQSAVWLRQVSQAFEHFNNKMVLVQVTQSFRFRIFEGF